MIFISSILMPSSRSYWHRISHLTSSASAFPPSRENLVSCHICRSDPPFFFFFLTLSFWHLRGRKSDFGTWTLTRRPPPPIPRPLKEKFGLSGEPLLIIGRWMGVKWELFITPSTALPAPPPPACTGALTCGGNPRGSCPQCHHHLAQYLLSTHRERKQINLSSFFFFSR